MFNGMPTRVFTAMVVCMQVLASMFLAIAIPAPQSLAREGKIQFEASDLVAEPEIASSAEPLPAGEPASLSDSGYDALPWCVADEASGREPLSPVEVGYPSEDAISVASDAHYGADELRVQGVIYDGGYRYTWYSQQVLPGGGLDIAGRHVSDEGYVVDSDERIVVASSDLPKGTEIDVPFGSGKAVVLDTGCASGTLDIYTDF